MATKEHSAAKPQKDVAQVSQPAVSPISNRQGVENTEHRREFPAFAGWKHCDTAGRETCATAPSGPAKILAACEHVGLLHCRERREIQTNSSSRGILASSRRRLRQRKRMHRAAAVRAK